MRKGFTLIELMIVIAIIAIIAAIAIPNLLESRITANENAAATSLKSAIFAAQTQYSAGSYSDLDRDNRGEYGHLGQLAGQEVTPGTDLATAPPNDGLELDSLALLGEEFDTTPAAAVILGDSSHHVTSSDITGYLFASFLAIDPTDAAGTITLASAQDPAGDQDIVNYAEKYYAVVAVPDVYDDTGRRCFGISQEGRVLSVAPKPTVGGVDLNRAAAETDFDVTAGAAAECWMIDGGAVGTGLGDDQDANIAAIACASPDNRDPNWPPYAR